jgi:hypothetical protein
LSVFAAAGVRRYGAMFLAAAIPLCAATYYVDAEKGDDSGKGTSITAPWRSIEKVNSASLGAGDRILLHSGSVWRGQLAPRSSGSDAAPIVIDRYGEGPRPRIDGAGSVEDAVRLYNVDRIEVHGLEITNRGDGPAVRRGVHIFANNFGVAQHIVIAGLYIHDVNGTNEKKDNGGIIFRASGDKVPSRFDGLTIARNIVWKVDRSAIAGQSYHWKRTLWNPSLHVVIRDNFVDDIGGDGIVPWATDGVLVEHNIARNCNRRSGDYNAGIWPWSADNSLFQLNEVAFTNGTRDSEGFDSDYNSRNTLFQYNYSHDNGGGFMLICTPGKRNRTENVGNTGTVVRYNISRDDRTRIFNLTGAEHTLIEGNAIYVGWNLDVQILLTSDWDGWADDAIFRKNRFYVEGTARYGHETVRNPDGTYAIAPGFEPARNIVFEGNRYAGRHIDRPADAAAIEEPLGGAARPGEGAPEFDPAFPDKFDEFLAAHRAWMVRMFEREFSKPLALGRMN